MPAHCVAIDSQLRPVALMIPGIGIAYSKAVELLRGNQVFTANCARAGIDDFTTIGPYEEKTVQDYLLDTLENQKLSYVVNCSMCDIYADRGVRPEMVVGYSMGIYAALYAAGHYAFETGLHILEEAYRLVSTLCDASPRKYSMGLVLGLTEQDIRTLLLKEVDDAVDIAVFNGMRSFVLAGTKEELNYCLEKALEEGAVSSRPLFSKYPYHSHFLKDVGPDFSRFLATLHYTTPSSKVLSLIDNEVITPQKVTAAIAQAMYTPLRFDAAVEAVSDVFQIDLCYETGPAKSMKKLIHYINKNVRVRPFEGI